MAQSENIKTTSFSNESQWSRKWVVHEKIKDHAQKVGSHVKKHHKKYLWWFFAGFAIAKTIKVIIAAVWILVSLNHVPGTIAADSYDWCVFEEQFCFDLAYKNKWSALKRLPICIKSWAQMIQDFDNWIVDKKTLSNWISTNFNMDMDTFISAYKSYSSKFCDCCDWWKVAQSCCEVKANYCAKSNDWQYADNCKSLSNQCVAQECKQSYDSCVFEEQFCIDWARKNTRNEKQVNLCIASWVEIVWYINKSTNDKVVSAFLQNLWRKWTSQEFAEPYNVYEKKGAICSCCNGEEWQKTCCDAKEQACKASSTKGDDDYCEQCSQLKSIHSRWWGGGGVGWLCEDSWYDWQFLNTDFWNNWDDSSLIDALFWDKSAYTIWWWDYKCEDMKVQMVYDRSDFWDMKEVYYDWDPNNPINTAWNWTFIWYLLNSNTIYVIDVKELEFKYPLFMDSCSAIVSNQNSQIFPTTYNQVLINWYGIGLINIYWSDYTIVDNIGLSGYPIVPNWVHIPDWISYTTPNVNWWCSGSHGHTINNVIAHGFSHAWFYIDGCNALLNNIQSFWNWNWIFVEKWSDLVSVNNAQSYRNAGYGILNYWFSSRYYNNIQSYSNNIGFHGSSNVCNDPGYSSCYLTVLDNMMVYSNKTAWLIDQWIWHGTLLNWENFIACNGNNNYDWFKLEDINQDIWLYSYVLGGLYNGVWELDISSDCLWYSYITNPFRDYVEEYANPSYVLYDWYSYPAYYTGVQCNWSNISDWSVYWTPWSRIWWYSYWSEIKSQEDPIVRLTHNSLEYVWSYNWSQYIWSTTCKVKDGYDLIQGYNSIQSIWNYNMSADSSELSSYVLWSPYYIFYWPITYSYASQILNYQSVTINSLWWLVTQLFWSNIATSGDWYADWDYFATHFEMTTQAAVDVTPPTITVTNPSTACAASKTISASATDTQSSIASMAYIKSTSTTCSASTAGTRLNYTQNQSITLNSESDSWQYLCFRAVDTAGNTWYQRSDKIINIDTVWPTVPSLSSPVNNHLTWNNRPTFTWGASTATWCATTVTYYVQTYSGSRSNVKDNTSSTSYTLTAGQALTDWVHYWRVRAKDNLWRYSSYASRTITIDTQGPICTWISWPTPTTLYYGQTWSITFRCTDTNYNTSATVTTSALSYTNNSVLQTLSVTSSAATNGRDYTFVYKQIWSGSTNISFNSNVFTDKAWNYNGWASASTAVTAVNAMDCPAGWNNDYFLTGRFWHLYYDSMPPQGIASEYKRKLLLCALYGAWPDDTTAYTKYWNGRQWWNTSNGCDVSNMSVSTTNTLPNTLTANTVYVVTSQNITRSAWIQMANCSAIVSVDHSNVTTDNYTHKYSTLNGSNNHTINWANYSILDNLYLSRMFVNWTGSRSTVHGLTIRTQDIGFSNRIGVKLWWTYNVLDTLNISAVEDWITVAWNNAIINNVDIYDYSEFGIKLWQWASYNTFNNIMIHDPYAWWQGHWYEWDGIGLRMATLSSNPTTWNAFNNMNIYNNGYGIIAYFGENAHQINQSDINYWNKFIFNNVQVYNNKSGWIYLWGLRNSVLNNVSSYNNGWYGVYTLSNTNKYHGKLIVTWNVNNTIQWFGVWSASSPLTAGTTSWIVLNWNYITNPKVASGHILVWTGNYPSLRNKFGSDGETFKTWYHRLLDDQQPIIWYSFWVNTKTQVQPMYYNGTTLQYHPSLSYDAEAYVWSTLKKVSGYSDIKCSLPNFELGQNSLVSLASTSKSVVNLAQLPADPGCQLHDCTVTGHAYGSPLISSFNLFKLNGSTTTVWTTIDTSTSSIWTLECKNDNLITQIVWNNYFATHFQWKNDDSCTTNPAAPTLSTPSDWTITWDNTPTLTWTPWAVTCNGASVSSYTVQICSDNTCSTVSQSSWTTSATYTATTLADGTYYWRVMETDSLWNSSLWSSTWSFTVKTSIACLQSSQWNNDNFLTGRFWSLNPSDDNIICALYGWTGTDWTAYTKQWDASMPRRAWQGCNVLAMRVVRTTALNLPLAANTIYVLNTWRVSPGIITMPECSAIVSRNGTVIDWSVYIQWFYAILDNVGIDNQNVMDYQCLKMNGVIYSTINNVQVYHAGYIWIDIIGSSYNLFNNVQVYWNAWQWIELSWWQYNSFNNLQIYSNGQEWLLMKKSGKAILSNIQIYNNGWTWFSATNSSGNILNNIWSYNNTKPWFYVTSFTNNTIYWQIKVFFNSGSSPAFWSTTNWSANAWLWFTAWSISQTWNMSYDLITNPYSSNLTYSLAWTENYSTLRWSSTWAEVAWYSYGSGIKTQVQPVWWSGTTLVAVWSYDSNQYIWGQVKKWAWSVRVAWRNDTNWTITFMWVQNLFSSYISGYRVLQLSGVSWSNWTPKSQQVTVTNAWQSNYIAQLTWAEMPTHFLGDGVKPTWNLTSTNALKQTSQRLTWVCTDAWWLSGFYLGTSSTPSYSAVPNNATIYTGWTNVSSAWTYYLFCQDTNGNEYSGSMIFRSYTVSNMLENLNWTTTSYNTNNYTRSGTTITYIAQNWTTIVYSNIWTDPGSCYTFVWWSVGTPTTSNATVNQTNQTLDGNKNYGIWYRRNTYNLTLNKWTWISDVTGAWTYKWWKMVNIDATVSAWYSWSKWTVGTTSTQYSATKATTVTMACEAKTLKANATANTYTVTYNKWTATAWSITVDWTTTQYASLPKVQSRTYPNASTLWTNNLTKSNTDVVTYTVTLSWHGWTPAVASKTTTRYTGYTANGWTTTQWSTTRDYANGATFGANSTTNLVLYPCFTQTATTPTITLPWATRNGYTFMWWSTASNDTWVEYASWASYTPSWDVTLYAVWKKTITVTFNVNSNGWTNSTKTCDMWNSDTSCTVTCPSITPATNYTTIWWSTAASTHSADACTAWW